MSLPSGYKLLEYIQSSGTQCIDSGYVVQSENMRVIIKIAYTAVHSDATIFGSETSGIAGSGEYSICPYGTPQYYVGGSKQLNSAYSPSINEVCTLDITAKNGTLVDIWNSSIQKSQSYTQKLNHTYSVAVFGNNISGAIRQKVSMKLYKFQLYDNDVLARDFIPCQTTAGEIGLWDDVNSVFYGNAGTGTFTAGPVLAIAANASEITKLEYIESSGTQYVDSGFIPNGESTVEIAFESAVIISATSGNYPVYGAASNYDSNAFELWSLANGFCTYGSQAYKSGFGLSANVKYVSKQAKNVLEINNQTLTFTKQTFSAPYSLLLFATHRDDRIAVSDSDAKLKIYFCKIYDNGTLIRDYIAAKLSDGTIGLYDKLHGLLYTNVGTGTFIAGPVVTSPSIFVNIDGIWKPINNIYVNINNIWQETT